MANVTNRSRVSSGVPTGGEFATEAKDENDDLQVAPDPSKEADARVEELFKEAWTGRLLDRNGGFSATVGRTANGDRVTVDFSMVKYRPEVIDARTGEYAEHVWAINQRIGLIPKGARNQAIINGTPAEAAKQFLPNDEQLAELGELFAGDDNSTGEHPFPLGMMVRGTPKQMEQDLELRKEVSGGRISYRSYLERRASEIPDDDGVKFGAERYYPPNPEAVERVFTLLRSMRARRVE